MINGFPYLEIGFTGSSREGSGKHSIYYTCNPSTVKINSTNASTTYYLPEFGDYAWVQTELNASYSAKVLDYLSTFRDLYLKSLPEKDQNGGTIKWEDISGYKMSAHKTHYVLVGKKGSGPMNTAAAKAMMALWTGFAYVYDILSVPIYRPVITKTNIEINVSVDMVPKEGDDFYAKLKKTRCYEA
ncbi:hypothetical protein GPJ56_008296 [Histomonas meleagridis]|uniref:uncharacterized protein n=1 Tax=Histomonas meleagridis TaxID=135588 RepID=UPI003559C4AD|nr:hypothetical protein GPJ56_008296 [Histomonas meleagridis]KAH0806866.1 hypothetical protein GO595_000042 [Histomonas meleagridis]